MFVAVCDQNFGNSTAFWSHACLSLPGMKASRSSHSISSNGSRPGMVKKRRTPRVFVLSTTTFSSDSDSVDCCVSCASRADAIRFLPCELYLAGSEPGSVGRAPDGADLQGFLTVWSY